MLIEPATKRAIAFFDGQNLFHGAREAFGYGYPNYCPLSLATRLCQERGWSLQGMRFYTGIPDPEHSEFWNRFWTAKLGTLGHQGQALTVVRDSDTTTVGVAVALSAPLKFPPCAAILPRLP